MNDQMNELENAWQWRYACKKFDPTKTIAAPQWQLLQKSLQMAPSSYGLQPYKFIVTQGKEFREKLKAASWNQTQVTDCSHYVIFVTKNKMTEDDVDRFISLTAQTRGTPVENLKGYRDMMVGHVVKGLTPEETLSWTRRQAYIAMGFLLQAAAELKIDSTPMEGIDAKVYDELLDLNKTPYRTVAAVALGYRHAEDGYQKAAKVRFPIKELVEIR